METGWALLTLSLPHWAAGGGKIYGAWCGEVTRKSKENINLCTGNNVLSCIPFFEGIRPAQYYQRGYVNNIILLKGLLFLKKSSLRLSQPPNPLESRLSHSFLSALTLSPCAGYFLMCLRPLADRPGDPSRARPVTGAVITLSWWPHSPQSQTHCVYFGPYTAGAYIIALWETGVRPWLLRYMN